MGRNQYFQKMRETARIVNPLVENSLQFLREHNNSLYEFAMQITKKKSKKMASIRPYLLRKSYEIVGGNNWQEIAPICAAYELLMTGIYYANHVYDEKHTVESKEDITKTVMASRICRDLATKIVLEWGKTHKNYDVSPEEIIGNMTKSDLFTEVGQYFDAFENIYSPNMNLDFDKMVDLYLNRTKLMGVVFLQNICKIGGRLGNATQEQLDALETFGHNYGIALQIVNDIADFVRTQNNTAEKDSNDVYCDIKHGKLTLPVIHALCFGSEETKELIQHTLRGGDVKNSTLEDITKALVNSGSMEFSKKIVRGYKNNAKKALKHFSKKRRKDISIMCVIFSSNRYYNALKEYR